MDVQMDALSVQEAAMVLGVTPKTIRRRIKQGTLQAVKQSTSQGYEWRVLVNMDGQVDTHTMALPVQEQAHAPATGGQVNTHQDASDVALKALSVLEQVQRDHQVEVEQLRRDNQQLAGQVGFLQAKLQDAQERITMLEAPKDEAPQAQPEPTPAAPRKRPWWQLLFNR
jgi:excisionase family DNA binding protein